MPINPSNVPSGKNWQLGGKGRTPGVPPAKNAPGPPAEADWQGTSKKRPGRSRINPWAPRFLWTLALLALGTLFYKWVPPTPLGTPLLLVVAADYDAPLPPNAWAQQDLERFQQFSNKSVLPQRLDPDPKHWKEALLDKIKTTDPGGPDKDLIVVYLSMHGAVNGDGSPCLVPPHAPALDSTKWTPVRSLLIELGKSAAENSRKPAKLLLVLDCNRMDANWGMGLLYNNFATALRSVYRDLEQEKEIDATRFFILNSAGPEQVGWASPRLRGSVFAHYLFRGLEGEAVHENGKMSLRELAGYLAKQVGDSVAVDWGDRQEPMLLRKTASTSRWYSPRIQKGKSPRKARPNPRTKGGRIFSGHGRVTKSFSRAPYRWDALAWERLQGELLRLEQLYFAGPSYKDEFDRTWTEASDLETELAAPTAAAPGPAASLGPAYRIAL